MTCNTNPTTSCSQVGRSSFAGPWGGFLAGPAVDVVAGVFADTVGFGIGFNTGVGVGGGGVAGFDVEGPGEGLGVGPASLASLFKRT